MPLRSLVAFSLALAACGGIAVIDPAGGAGSGGSGGSGGSAGAGGSGASAGSGGAGASAGSGGGGGSGACLGLDEVSCLGAYPSCVPRYDDQCCPSCNPGSCADCVDWGFESCQPAQAACEAPSACGFVPDWACAGKQAECPDGQPCNFQPGCTEQLCAVGDPCPGTILCSPVTAGTCSSFCDSVPPTCPPGSVPEADGFCYTGFCVEASLCVLPL